MPPLSGVVEGRVEIDEVVEDASKVRGARRHSIVE